MSFLVPCKIQVQSQIVVFWFVTFLDCVVLLIASLDNLVCLFLYENNHGAFMQITLCTHLDRLSCGVTFGFCTIDSALSS